MTFLQRLRDLDQMTVAFAATPLKHLPVLSTGWDGVKHHMVPFPLASKPIVPSRIIDAAMRSKVRELIPLDQVRASQKTVTDRGVRQYLRGGRDRAPIVIKTGIGYVVQDGHHRLTSSMLRGKKKAYATVVREFAGKFKARSHSGDLAWKSQKTHLSPKRFLKVAAPFGPSGPYQPAVEKYRAMIREGKQVEMPRLWLKRSAKHLAPRFQVTGHEGRHRATAAIAEGIGRIPVEIVTYNEPRFPQRSPELRRQIVDQRRWLKEPPHSLGAR